MGDYIGSINIHWAGTSRKGCDHFCPVLIKPWDDGLCPHHKIDSIDTIDLCTGGQWATQGHSYFYTDTHCLFKFLMKKKCIDTCKTHHVKYSDIFFS